MTWSKKSAVSKLTNREREEVAKIEAALMAIDKENISDIENRFVDSFLRTFAPVTAMREAGFERCTNLLANRLLQKPEIKAEISRRMSSTIMSKEEVLWRLTLQARNKYSEYIDAAGKVDLAKMIEDGTIHLVKCIVPTRYGIKVEFVDGQRSLELIGKHYKLFTEKIDLGGAVTVNVVYEDPIELDPEDGLILEEMPAQPDFIEVDATVT